MEQRPGQEPEPEPEQWLEPEPEPEPELDQWSEPEEPWGLPAGRDRALSLDSTGSDFDRLLQAAAFGESVSDEIVDAEVSLDVELTRTMTSTFQKSARTGGSSAVAALIDGEEVPLSDDELESDHFQPEHEPEPEPDPQPYPDRGAAAGPRFDAARLKRAAKARANPVWERSKNNGGSATCMWCDEPFGLTCRRYNCRRCGWAVCDGCSPHRSALDTWLEGDKPHAVRSDLSDSMLRVCDGCARAAHEPAAAPVFYLATSLRISDQITVVRSTALCVTLCCVALCAALPRSTSCAEPADAVLVTWCSGRLAR